METPNQMCTRLVAALEDLTSQEAASLEARDFVATIEIQERAQPLVDLLVAHGPEITSSELKSRIAALVVRRNQTGEWLAEQLARTREALRQTRVAQRQVAQVAPAYGNPAPSAHGSLLAVG